MNATPALASGASVARPAPWSNWPIAWGIALAFVVTLIAYLPAVRAGFIWNDVDYVTKPALRGVGGLWRIWFEPGATEQYYPFLHTAFWIEHKLWADATAGYHLANVLQHAAAAALLGLVLTRLAIPGAWLAATVFALHPVYVESVAWISEQKNTLSMVFYLAAALVYLRFDERRTKGAYAVATLLFLLAGFSKSVAVTLPAALLVVFWWKRGRLDIRRDVQPLLPWFFAGAAIGLFTAWVEHTYIGATGSDFELSFLGRALLSGRVFWFYLANIFWPANLIFIYPRWQVDPGVAWQWLFTPLALAAFALLWTLRRRTRAPLAAGLFFVGSLFPTIGFLNVYAFKWSYVADHLQYLPSLGPLVLATAGIALALGRLPPRVRWMSWAAPAVILGALGVLTWRQCGLYRDIETFYRLTLESNPKCWMASLNLGKLLMDNDRLPEAITEFERALRIKPGYSKAENNLGIAWYRLGRVDAAVAHLESAVRLDPNFSEACYNLGVLLRRVGRKEEALALLVRASELTPRAVDVWNALGICLADMGRPEDAILVFEEALKIQPDHADARAGLEAARARAGTSGDPAKHEPESDPRR